MSKRVITEKQIRRTLEKVAKQRVAMILQPGNVWVVERAVRSEDETVNAALKTCHMRGWIEPLIDSIPEYQFTPGGDIIEKEHRKPIYRLTEAGWSKIHESHAWVIATLVIASCSLLATLISIGITASMN